MGGTGLAGIAVPKDGDDSTGITSVTQPGEKFYINP